METKITLPRVECRNHRPEAPEEGGWASGAGCGTGTESPWPEQPTEPRTVLCLFSMGTGSPEAAHKADLSGRPWTYPLRLRARRKDRGSWGILPNRRLFSAGRRFCTAHAGFVFTSLHPSVCGHPSVSTGSGSQHCSFHFPRHRGLKKAREDGLAEKAGSGDQQFSGI